MYFSWMAGGGDVRFDPVTGLGSYLLGRLSRLARLASGIGA